MAALPGRTGRTSSPIGGTDARHGAPCLHPFRARSAASSAAPSRSAKAGGSRSTGSTKPACRRFTASAAAAVLDARSAACRLSPSSPAPVSTAPIRLRARSASDRRARRARRRARAVWRDGLPGLDERRPARLAAESATPTLFLGLDGDAPRFSRSPEPATRGRAPSFRCSAQLDDARRAAVRRRAQPGALAFAPSLLRQLRRTRPRSSAAAGRGAARLAAPSISRASIRS